MASLDQLFTYWIIIRQYQHDYQSIPIKTNGKIPMNFKPSI